MLPQSGGRLRSPSDPSGLTQRTKPKVEKLDFPKIEEERDQITINNELDFGRWYHGVQEGLLEASYEDYQYVKSNSCAICATSVPDQALIDLAFTSSRFPKLILIPF